MNLVNQSDIIGDILKFKGFMKSSLKDKLLWIFVLYPFALFVVLYHSILWIPEIPLMIIKKIKKRK